MGRSVTSLYIIILCFSSKAYSQSTCPPNLDFESGNFSNWECFTGKTDTLGGKNIMRLFPSPPTPNRHTIIRAADNPGLDPFGQFPMLCPSGGNYSVMLGNSGTGAGAEAISYTFQVPTTVDTFTFTYFYAVVFQDPKHITQEQPRFFVTAYDVATGATINCASFDYVSNSLLPGFTQSPVSQGVLYKSWTPTSLQFAGLKGHMVRLEFRTGDCVPGAHFGYAYLDVASACSNILATAPYCIETNALILNAPFGFQNYTWHNPDFSAVVGSGQSITLSPPPVTTGVFYVDVEPYPGFGCRDTLQAFVKPFPVPDTPDAKTAVSYCQHQVALPLTATVSPGHQLLWYTSETGGIATTTAPVPSTTMPGKLKYYVSKKALYGCEGFRREIVVTVNPNPVVAFTIDNSRQCLEGNHFSFKSTSTVLYNPTYIWSYDYGKYDTTTNPFSDRSYPATGDYRVRLQVINADQCSADKYQTVTVVPKPIASFTYPSLLCENQTPVALTDRSYNPSGNATINKWWWDINGEITQGKVPKAATAPPGPLPVKLVVSTTEGCLSDTVTETLNIRYAPVPAFGISDLLCNNELIRFTDQSVMPLQSAGEVITKWYWTFDNTVTTTSRNPATYFKAGTHKAQLMAENNLGCKSALYERSFEIHPKPAINVHINDSCVFIPITYTVNDLLGNVISWNWDFGNGFKAGPSSITKTYNATGSVPFTLITQTDKDCKDTLNRPFTIFDNRSFAGDDTVAAFNEPVHLDANGEPGMLYKWSPATGLDHPDIEMPVATLDHDQLYQLHTVTAKGCKKQSDIFIKRYAGPELYVPNAFTPNNDGVNDRLKVTPIGIRSFGYFAVFNRWGQMIYRTTNYNEGWDGTVSGARSATGTYVFVVQATDYRGKPMVKKGTVVLLR
jgi:gliding motility-associated-like protein